MTVESSKWLVVSTMHCGIDTANKSADYYYRDSKVPVQVKAEESMRPDR